MLRRVSRNARPWPCRTTISRICRMVRKAQKVSFISVCKTAQRCLGGLQNPQCSAYLYPDLGNRDSASLSHWFQGSSMLAEDRNSSGFREIIIQPRLPIGIRTMVQFSLSASKHVNHQFIGGVKSITKIPSSFGLSHTSPRESPAPVQRHSIACLAGSYSWTWGNLLYPLWFI